MIDMDKLRAKLIAQKEKPKTNAEIVNEIKDLRNKNKTKMDVIRDKLRNKK